MAPLSLHPIFQKPRFVHYLHHIFSFTDLTLVHADRAAGVLCRWGAVHGLTHTVAPWQWHNQRSLVRNPATTRAVRHRELPRMLVKNPEA